MSDRYVKTFVSKTGKYAVEAFRKDAAGIEICAVRVDGLTWEAAQRFSLDWLRGGA